MTWIYRPVGNDFLDRCSPLAFWKTREGVERDFPDDEIKAYTDDEVYAYCESKNLSPEDIKLYR